MKNLHIICLVCISYLISLIKTQEPAPTQPQIKVGANLTTSAIDIYTQELSFKEGPKSFRIRFESLIEKNINGTEVDNVNEAKHKVARLADLEPEVVTVTDSKFQNISVVRVYVKTKKIANLGATIEHTGYIFKESGIVNFGGFENFNVSQGVTAYSFTVNDWPYCQPANVCKDITCCVNNGTNQVGSFLDLNLTFNGDDEAKRVSSDENIFRTPAGDFYVSPFVLVGSNFTQMGDDFDFYVGNSFNLRIPASTSPASTYSLVALKEVRSDTLFVPTGSNAFLIIVLIILIFALVGFVVFYFFIRRKRLIHSDELITTNRAISKV